MSLNLPECGELECFSKDDDIFLLYSSVFKWVTSKLPSKNKLESRHLKKAFEKDSGMCTSSGILYVSITAFIRYIFHHSDAICLNIQNILIRRSLNVTNPSHLQSTQLPQDSPSIKDLYQRVVKLPMATTQPATLPSTLPWIDPSLQEVFSETECSKIRLFEHHFITFHAGDMASLGSNATAARLSFLEQCERSCDLGKTLQPFCQQAIQLTSQRKALGQAMDGATLEDCGILHRPQVLESEVRTALLACGCVLGIVAILPDLVQGVIVLVETSTHSIDIHSMSTIIDGVLNSTHSLRLKSLYTVPINELNVPFVHSLPTSGIQRFTLRDKLIHGELNVLHSKKNILPLVPDQRSSINTASSGFAFY